ncbi:MAG: hypothetical protein WC901_05510 [Candidatus Margulisiibacteriota bacterium]
MLGIYGIRFEVTQLECVLGKRFEAGKPVIFHYICTSSEGRLRGCNGEPAPAGSNPRRVEKPAFCLSLGIGAEGKPSWQLSVVETDSRAGICSAVGRLATRLIVNIAVGDCIGVELKMKNGECFVYPSVWDSNPAGELLLETIGAYRRLARLGDSGGNNNRYFARFEHLVGLAPEVTVAEIARIRLMLDDGDYVSGFNLEYNFGAVKKPDDDLFNRGSFEWKVGDVVSSHII